MIFVTVGNMDPFDRLIQVIDRWIGSHRDIGEVFAQIGKGSYRPTNCEHVSFLTPNEYRDKFEQASLIVSHAGMGTIITALELQKPIVVMPKRATLGEQRNEHQLATVRHFQRSKQVLVAESEADLMTVLDNVLSKDMQLLTNSVTTSGESAWPADPKLIQFVRAFVS